MKVLLSSLLVFAAVWVWFGLYAPDVVPGHFDAAGQVDRWDSKGALLAILGVLGAAMAILFGTTRRWIGRIPSSAVNLPSRRAHAYWTAPVRRGELDDVMSTTLELIGAGCLLLLTAVLVVSGRVAAGGVIPAAAFPALLAAFLAATIGAVVYLLRRLRVPPDAGQE